MNDGIQSESKNWKLGVVYYNPKDSRSFVPKRIGIGWTLNFAQPFSYLIPIAIILLAIVLGKIL
jgi:uncharacterized membrane protein